MGEYIASEVFDIELNTRRNAKGDDGVFRSGPYAGQGVNVKWYSKHTGILDVNPHGVSHHYLVLTGPRAGGSPKTNPWLIREVYLFDGPTVVQHLVSRGCRVAEASSVLQEHWTEAMVYPHDRHPEYSLTEEQKTALALFA
ncbi:MAG: hypothetical protein QME79_12080 [Bacillota bacterium]|nr:hypothetical protein [Bacillota bacterium]